MLSWSNSDGWNKVRKAMIDRTDGFPKNFESLHAGEEQLRQKALEIVRADTHLQLHIAIVEAAMDLTDLFRQLDTENEDLKVVQLLGMRCFNAFGASLKLALSGYHQNSALLLRDILETAFLLDLFSGDRGQIGDWRTADKRSRLKAFSPVKVREALDARDGFTSKKRFEMYELFSELAGHPNMKSQLMLQPVIGGDAVNGPFMEATSLQAVISEMGRLAVQIGNHLVAFFPTEWREGLPARMVFAKLHQRWFRVFYLVEGEL